MSRIIQVANFVTPSSGGLRTALLHLAQGYGRAGHEVVQVLPGRQNAVEATPWGRRVFLESTQVPGLGYRILLHAMRVQEVLSELDPDVLEVHDRTSLRGLGPWAARRQVPSLVVSHERLDRWLQQWLSPRLPLEAIADRSNGALARGFDEVVCTTSWAAEEFTRIGVSNLRIVPLGVDLDGFRPGPLTGTRDEVVLVMVSRLSREKRPDLAVEALRELRRRGVPARLVVAGDGAMRSQLAQLAGDLPIEWLGFVGDRQRLAALMAAADVVLAPGPVESFGVAALEALACGTPVVVNHHAALPGVAGLAGRSAASSGFVFAEAVLELLTVDEPRRRARARARAEQFPWEATIQGFLEAHELLPLRLAS